MHRPADIVRQHHGPPGTLPNNLVAATAALKMGTRTPPKITPGNPKAVITDKDVPEVIYDGNRKISYQRGRFLGKVIVEHALII